MRRTIKTLMFLAIGGLVCAASATGQTRGTGNYYASGVSTFNVSDDGEAGASADVPAAYSEPFPGQEQQALYMANSGSTCPDCARTSFFDRMGSSCDGTSYGSSCGDCDCTVNTARLEYLMWFSRGRNLPPLVTTSPAGTPQANAGIVGLATTTTAYGNDPIATGIRNGGRITVGHLFQDGITRAEGRFWGIEDSSQRFVSGNANILAVPFFNTSISAPDALLLNFPGVRSGGGANVLSKNDLIGADAWVRRSWYRDCCSQVDLLGGYQFTRLDDSLVMNTTTTSLVAPGAGTAFAITDSFRTQNEFHGGTLGFLAQTRRGAFNIELLGKIGLGNMRQAVIINGATTTTPLNGVAVTQTGGFLAQPTNIGSYQRNQIAFVPEVNLNLVYNLTQSWRIVGGYSFIYWNNVVLAGNQIDTSINPSQLGGAPLVGGPSPNFAFHRSDFWVQGLSFGGEYRW